MTKLATALAVVISLAADGPAAAQQTPVPAAVEWPLPPAAPVKPQTDDEKQRGMSSGRDFPPLELCSPRWTRFAGNQPRTGAKLKGTSKPPRRTCCPRLRKRGRRVSRVLSGRAIDVDPPYAGSLGAKELVKGNLDFVFVSRELKPDDITDFHAKFGYDPLSVPVSGGSYRHFGFLDAVGFIVNKDNPIERITFDQLDALFSSTHFRGTPAATTWGDLGLGGEWANKPVHLVGVKPWNGFEEFIRQRVLSTPGHRGEWRDGIDYSPTVFPIADKVAKDRYAIAYDGLAYLSAPVKVLPVGAHAAGPFYAPSYENVASADYPLTRLIFFNLNKAPGKPLDPAAAEFLRFVLSRQGQAIVQAQRLYMPLRAVQAQSSLSLFAR